jgi:hypothetical protein
MLDHDGHFVYSEDKTLCGRLILGTMGIAMTPPRLPGNMLDALGQAISSPWGKAILLLLAIEIGSLGGLLARGWLWGASLYGEPGFVLSLPVYLLFINLTTLPGCAINGMAVATWLVATGSDIRPLGPWCVMCGLFFGSVAVWAHIQPHWTILVALLLASIYVAPRSPEWLLVRRSNMES